MRRVNRKMATVLVIAAIGAMGVAESSAAGSAARQDSLRAAIHVHSTMSTGSLSLESLARRAEDQQLDVLILSENFTLRYDYGLQPFEGSLRCQVTFPSVMEYGIQRFLDEVRDVQHHHPNLIIIPGVEVAPYYYWTGSLWHGNLTMHDAQRNLLIIGLERAEDYEQLPARGNSHSFVWGWRSIINGFPLFLLIPAAWLWKSHDGRRFARKGSVSHLRRGLAIPLAIMALVLTVNAWPMKVPVHGSYAGGTGYRPYQDLINKAIERGALVFWSMTEARDFSRHSFGPLGTVTVKTEPHPDALVLTYGYTGFGGLYQDARRIVEPGGVWDQVLRSSMASGHKVFPTIIGEAAFHGTTAAGEGLDRVFTVIQTAERTVAGIMAALKAGHAYAVARGDQNILLRLDEFSVSHNGQSARIGETLDGIGNGDIIVRVGISAVDGKSYAAKIRILRSGEVIRKIEGRTPLQIAFADREAQAEEWMNYRVEAVSHSGELLTNPIYVAPIHELRAHRSRQGSDLLGTIEPNENAAS